MFVALVIQHAKRMRRVILSRMAYPALPYFSTLFHKRRAFRKKKVIEYKMCVLILCTVLSEIFLIFVIIQGDIVINIRRSSCKVSVVPVLF